MIITFSLQFVEWNKDDISKLDLQFLIIVRMISDPLEEFFTEYYFPNMKNKPEDFKERKEKLLEELQDMLLEPQVRIKKPYELSKDFANQKELFIRGKQVGLEVT